MLSPGSRDCGSRGVLAGAGEARKEPAYIVLHSSVQRTRASSQAHPSAVPEVPSTCSYLALDAVQASYLRGLSVNEGSINI